MRQALAQKAGRLVADFRRQGVEDAQAAQGKSGIVEIGAALPAGEAAVGVLGRGEVSGVAGTGRFRQPGDAVGQMRREQ